MGGLAPGACKLLRRLKRRAKATRVDRTEYTSWAAADYETYWGQRIASAVINGDGDRALRRLRALRTQALNAMRDRARATAASPPTTVPYQEAARSRVVWALSVTSISVTDQSRAIARCRCSVPAHAAFHRVSSVSAHAAYSIAQAACSLTLPIKQRARSRTLLGIVRYTHFRY